MKIDVILVARDATAESVRAKNAVVIDVLRATSTMSTALSNGSRAIYAVTSPDDAFRLASAFAGGACLIGGERGGIKVQGFDLGNSPREYTREMVSGKSLIMTTTNGTLAINNCARAHKVYLCALLNASAVAQRLAADQKDVVLVCSGTEGEYTMEDAYCAGLVIERLALSQAVQLSDLAVTCNALFRQYKDDPLLLLETALHGQKLRRIGFGQDLEYCAQVDLLQIVPTLREGAITVA